MISETPQSRHIDVNTKPRFTREERAPLIKAKTGGRECRSVIDVFGIDLGHFGVGD